MAIIIISLYDSSSRRAEARKKIVVDIVKKIRSGSRFFIFCFHPSKPGSLGFVQIILDKILNSFINKTSILADIAGEQKQ